MRSRLSDWEVELAQWLKPFLDRLGQPTDDCTSFLIGESRFASMTMAITMQQLTWKTSHSAYRGEDTMKRREFF
jgi:hypothetical protein